MLNPSNILRQFAPVQLYQRWLISISITNVDPLRYDSSGSYFSQGLLQGRMVQSIQDIIKNNFLAAKELSGTNAGRLCNKQSLTAFPMLFLMLQKSFRDFFFFTFKAMEKKLKVCSILY